MRPLQLLRHLGPKPYFHPVVYLETDMSIRSDPELLSKLDRIVAEASPRDGFMVQLQRACAADYARRIMASLPPLADNAKPKVGADERQTLPAAHHGRFA